MEKRFVVEIDGVVFGVGASREDAIRDAKIENKSDVREYPREGSPDKGVPYLCECTSELSRALEGLDGILPLAWDRRAEKMGIQRPIAV